MGLLFSALGGAALAKATRNIGADDASTVGVVFAASHRYAFFSAFISAFIGENFVIEVNNVQLAFIRY